MDSPILLIANPAAGRASRRRIQRAVELIHAAGHEVDLHLTQKRGDAEGVARRAAEGGVSLVVAAGGDGTINEVVNGIVYSKTSLALLPLGTTNVLAKEINIPEDVKGAIDIALKKSSQIVSLGCARFVSNASRVTRYFCLMAGIGFDGEAVYRFNQSVKRFSGKGAYVLSGLKTLVSFSPGPLMFTLDGETLSGYSAIIGNVSKYGGNFRVTPDASLLKPEFYACIMRGRRRMDVLRYLFGVLSQRHRGFKDILYRKVSSVEVTGNAHIQIDGDYAGETPAIITAEPYALRLIF